MGQINVKISSYTFGHKEQYNHIFFSHVGPGLKTTNTFSAPGTTAWSGIQTVAIFDKLPSM